MKNVKLYLEAVLNFAIESHIVNNYLRREVKASFKRIKN